MPEPFALSLFGIGLAGAAGLSRRKLAKAQSIIFESAAPDDGACDFVSEADPALLQARPRSPLSD